jgi:hypothetical protein
MKKTTIIMMLFALFTSAYSQVVDNSISDAGDIAFTAYHNTDDGFSFVFLDNCPSGTTIRFVDEEWNGSAFVSENLEGEVLWTNDTGSMIMQGTVIHIQNADNHISISASLGIATEDDSGFGIASSNDGIIAITGTRSVPGVFLAFFGDTTDSSLTGTSLVNGFTANQQTSYGTGYYSGNQSCTGLSITECSERINSFSNWTIAASFTYPTAVMQKLEINTALQVDNTKKLKANYHPNPVADILNIETKKSISNIHIYNILGQEVFFENLNKNAGSIDLSNLTSGTYYVKYYSNDSSYTFQIQKL